MDYSPAERAELNLIQTFRTWSGVAGGRAWEGEGFTCVSTPVKKRAFNHIFVTSPQPDVTGLREAVEWYASQGLPLRARARPELDAGDIMTQVGLHFEGSMPCMALDGEMPTGPVTDLRVEHVADAKGLADLVSVVGESFDWTPEQMNPIFNPSIVSQPGWYAWVGYADGEPATSSQLVVHEGTAGLYHIATAVKHRNKGYGDAITRTAVLEGEARDCDLTTLYASALGYPVYKRLGFEDAGEYQTYRPD